ncbi:hypothetical protein ACFQGB_14025 [Halorubellus litoreus]|uniref:C1q domain-containing protein n=1 Tax=Halorubellus litoreus TaxID=755308 RepID=A0ABD5VF59_9EURY
MKGNAFSSSGNTEGVFGLAKSTSGTGVKGKASADSGFTKGVQGLAKSPDGRGVQGVAYSTSGENIGVRGETKSSTKNATGVKGHATASSGQTYGVEGETDSGDGAGVAGKLTTDSFSYPDLSENPSGVLGVTDRSTDDSTVFGPTGVLGLATASSGARVGVIGRTTSPGGVGILGVTQDNGGIGVYSAGNSVTGGDHIVNGTVARKSTSIAYASSDQSIPFGVETTVAFDSVDKDDFTTFDTENNEFVVPELGEYRVDFAVKWAEPLESGTEHEVIIRSSVAKDITFTRKTPTNGGSSVVHDTGSTVIPHLTAGDTISIVVRHDASSSVDLAGGRASTHVSFTHLG